MMRKELVLASVAGAVAAVVTTAGTHFAFADESHAVNPAPMAAPAAVAPGSFANIVQRVAPAVVSIEVEEAPTVQPAIGPGESGNGQDPFDQLRRMFPQFGFPNMPPPGPVRGAGSGFFVSPDGYIVTNNHVVHGATKITVRTQDGKTYKAHVVGTDPATDLAVVKVEGHGFPFVSFEDRAQPRVGDWVVALGNPFNLGGTATAGIVSALRRPNISGSSYVDYMQIDAPINRGNSGGPTFDVYGRVVGVNSAIFTPSGGSVGIGFDIPADVAAKVVHQLIANGKVVRGFIGAAVQDVTPEIAESMGVKPRAGALVADVTPGGPSDHAGLKMGDLVRAVDGHPVTSASQLTRAVALVQPGQRMTLEITRDGRPQTLTLTAARRPSEEALASNAPFGGDQQNPAAPAKPGALGLVVSPNAGGGLRVDQVDPDSDAAQKGVRAGDVLQAIGSRRTNTVADVHAALKAAHAEHRKEVLLLIARNGQHLYLPVAPMSEGAHG